MSYNPSFYLIMYYRLIKSRMDKEVKEKSFFFVWVRCIFIPSRVTVLQGDSLFFVIGEPEGSLTKALAYLFEGVH